MKIHNIALALGLMLATTQILAKDPDTATFQIPDDQEENTNRYIVKYKAGSKVFKKRMRKASNRQAAKNLRKRVSPDEMFLAYGRFLPQDDAEVLYLNSDEEIRTWEEKDDVEYVELGT